MLGYFKNKALQNNPQDLQQFERNISILIDGVTRFTLNKVANNNMFKTKTVA